MATRTSSAVWEGNLKEGKGTMKVGRGAYEGPFSFASRFEDGAGTNPEELIGAAESVKGRSSTKKRSHHRKSEPRNDWWRTKDHIDRSGLRRRSSGD
jgi:hypothetical protein